MLWAKALHIIFMVTWFSGLFYLPRLFVYHSECKDEISNARFKIMERKLYFGITTPGAILTVLFGLWTFHYHTTTYIHLHWMQIKLVLILFLILYHFLLGKWLFDFRYDKNKHSSVFYRFINEVPVIFLVGIILLAILKPI